MCDESESLTAARDRIDESNEARRDERARLLAAVRQAVVTYSRPGLGNGPEHGQHVKVVPWAVLEELLGPEDDGPALESRITVTSRSGGPLTIDDKAREAMAEAGLAVLKRDDLDDLIAILDGTGQLTRWQRDHTDYVAVSAGLPADSVTRQVARREARHAGDESPRTAPAVSGDLSALGDAPAADGAQ
jgi:hypothetical protein